MPIRHYPVIIAAISGSSVRLRLINSEEEYIITLLEFKEHAVLIYEIKTLQSMSKKFSQAV